MKHDKYPEIFIAGICKYTSVVTVDCDVT